MVATPMRLVDALRFNGYTIDRVEIPETTVTVSTGSILIPEMLGSGLTWRREGDPPDSASFYLTRLPVFAEEYRPVILSNILDRFMNRRIGYNTPDEFGLAVRRWANLNLGPNSVLYRRYLSAAVDLPLTTEDTTETGSVSSETTGTSADEAESTSTDKARTAASDFPQGQLADDVDYATTAADNVGTSTGSSSASRTTGGTLTGSDTRSRLGRQGRTVAEIIDEQRRVFINADDELLASFESLMLAVYDQPERGEGSGVAYPSGYPYGNPYGW